MSDDLAGKGLSSAYGLDVVHPRLENLAFPMVCTSVLFGLQLGNMLDAALHKPTGQKHEDVIT